MKMPQSIYGALVSYIKEQLGFECWLNLEPEQLDTLQRKLPYVAVEGRIATTWGFENAWRDSGIVGINALAADSSLANSMAMEIWNLFGNSASWESIPIEGGKFSEVSRTGYELHTESQKDVDGNAVYRFETQFQADAAGVYVYGNQ